MVQEVLVLIWVSATWAATLAVLPFDNHSGNATHDALGVGVADMMVTDLDQLEALDLVERSRMADLLAEMALSRSEYVDPATAARAGKGVGAEWILVGDLGAAEAVDLDHP